MNHKEIQSVIGALNILRDLFQNNKIQSDYWLQEQLRTCWSYLEHLIQADKTGGH